MKTKYLKTKILFIVLINIVLSADDFKTSSFDIELNIIDQNGNYVKDETLIVKKHLYDDVVLQSIRNGRYRGAPFEFIDNELQSLNGIPLKLKLRNVRYIEISIELNSQVYQHQSMYIDKGGKYTIKVIRLEEPPQKFQYEKAIGSMQLTDSTFYQYKIGAVEKKRGRPQFSISSIDKNTDKIKYDLIIKKDFNTNKVSIFSNSKKIQFYQTKKTWHLLGYAENIKSKDWIDSLDIPENEFKRQNFILFHTKEKRYGKLAIMKKEGHFEYILLWANNISNNFLSTFELTYPRWLNQDFDKLKELDLGIIEFTPIREWNYPVE